MGSDGPRSSTMTSGACRAAALWTTAWAIERSTEQVDLAIEAGHGGLLLDGAEVEVVLGRVPFVTTTTVSTTSPSGAARRERRCRTGRCTSPARDPPGRGRAGDRRLGGGSGLRSTLPPRWPRRCSQRITARPASTTDVPNRPMSKPTIVAARVAAAWDSSGRTRPAWARSKPTAGMVSSASKHLRSQAGRHEQGGQAEGLALAPSPPGRG